VMCLVAWCVVITIIDGCDVSGGVVHAPRHQTQHTHQ
jgi:hypothetical protein